MPSALVKQMMETLRAERTAPLQARADTGPKERSVPLMDGNETALPKRARVLGEEVGPSTLPVLPKGST